MLEKLDLRRDYAYEKLLGLKEARQIINRFVAKTIGVSLEVIEKAKLIADVEKLDEVCNNDGTIRVGFLLNGFMNGIMEFPNPLGKTKLIYINIDDYLSYNVSNALVTYHAKRQNAFFQPDESYTYILPNIKNESLDKDIETFIGLIREYNLADLETYNGNDEYIPIMQKFKEFMHDEKFVKEYKSESGTLIKININELDKDGNPKTIKQFSFYTEDV